MFDRSDLIRRLERALETLEDDDQPEGQRIAIAICLTDSVLGLLLDASNRGTPILDYDPNRRRPIATTYETLKG
jgi:hypothetical protein